MSSDLRRGFKAECERDAEEIRSEIGLTLTDRLNPFGLAEYLEVPCYALSNMVSSGLSAVDVRTLAADSAKFSALTVGQGNRRSVLYNDYHSSSRIVSDVTHELSHIFLRHPLLPAFGDGGCRVWDNEAENEAVWHSGTLLVPRDGAFELLRRGFSQVESAQHFGVSLELFRWRVQMTGVLRVLGLKKAS